MVKKILVIEHQADTRNFFLNGLKAKGFHTISADFKNKGVLEEKW